MPSISNPCFTCGILDDPSTVPGGILWRDAHAMLNHHEVVDQETEQRSGWLIASPVRHVERLYDLSAEEWGSLTRIIHSADRALTNMFGSERTLAASLGWFTRDHIHFHCVPTFGKDESLGSLNFDGAYQPVPYPPEEVARLVTDHMRMQLGEAQL
jgi:diadenosine tetraphosphate (Ap4A) HIT family hydrolase